MSSFDLTFAELIDEATERAGLDPAALTHRHLNSISRSMQFLLTELEAKGCRDEFRISTDWISLPVGHGAVILPADTIDVTAVSLDVQGRPYPLGRTTRDDYNNLSFPTSPGMPSVFWLSKSLPTEVYHLTPLAGASQGWGTAAWGQGGHGSDGAQSGFDVTGALRDNPILVLWPQCALPGARVQVTRIRQYGMPSGLADQIDARRNWLDTIGAGLAARIAEKFNPDLEPKLQGKYEAKLARNEQDEDHHPVVVGFRGFGWSRQRRH